MGLETPHMTIPFIIAFISFLTGQIWLILVRLKRNTIRIHYLERFLKEKLKSGTITKEIIKELPQPNQTVIIKESKYSKIIAYGTILSAIALIINLIWSFLR